MPEKINPYIRSADQPKEEYMEGKGGISKVVRRGLYKVGQWITDNIFYAGEGKPIKKKKN